jgi:hypothetical protein
MKSLRSRSFILSSAIAVSAGFFGPVAAQTPQQKDACSDMLVPDGATCMVSVKTGQPVAVSIACSGTVAAVSFPAGTNPLKTGISLNGGPVCKVDSQTDLPSVVSAPHKAKALPPIKAHQQKARAILAAATGPNVKDACSGMTVPSGMICLVNPKTGRPTARWNYCLDSIAPPLTACVVDPETGSPMIVALP